MPFAPSPATAAFAELMKPDSQSFSHRNTEFQLDTKRLETEASDEAEVAPATANRLTVEFSREEGASIKGGSLGRPQC